MYDGRNITESVHISAISTLSGHNACTNFAILYLIHSCTNLSDWILCHELPGLGRCVVESFVSAVGQLGEVEDTVNLVQHSK